MLHEPDYDSVEAQAWRGVGSAASGAQFDGCDINSNSFSRDSDTGARRIIGFLVSGREVSGDSFDDGPVLLLQIAHSLFRGGEVGDDAVEESDAFLERGDGDAFVVGVHAKDVVLGEREGKQAVSLDVAKTQES